MKNREFFPCSQDIHDRTERLYHHLLAMGLIVDPIFEDGELAALHVEVSSPPHKAAKNAAHTRISSPINRSKIREMVATAQSSGSNVIDMPTIKFWLP